MKQNALEPLIAMLKNKKNSSRRAREYVAGALMNLTLRQPTMQADVSKAGAIPLLVEMLQEVRGAGHRSSHLPARADVPQACHTSAASYVETTPIPTPSLKLPLHHVFGFLRESMRLHALHLTH